MVKSIIVEQEDLLSKFSDYDSHIQSVELEKQNLNQCLQQSQTISQANQEQIDSLSATLNKEVRQRKTEQQLFEANIEELESKKSSLERRIKLSEADISFRENELAGLKDTFSNMTSVSNGLKAQFNFTKLLLEDHSKRIAELEAETSRQVTTIAVLENKLLEGETLQETP